MSPLHLLLPAVMVYSTDLGRNHFEFSEVNYPLFLPLIRPSANLTVTNLERAGPAAFIIQHTNPFAKLIKFHLQTPQALLAPCPLLDRILLMLILACCVIFRKQLSARKRRLEEKQEERHQRAEPHAEGLSTTPAL